MAIKFQQHAVVNTETGAKCRVHYSYNANGTYGLPGSDKPECVVVYAKGYLDKLYPVLEDVQNDSDLMTDYFEKDRAVIRAGHPLFVAAKAACDAIAARRESRWNQRMQAAQAA